MFLDRIKKEGEKNKGGKRAGVSYGKRRDFTCRMAE